jgi:hypothetical protein
MSHHTLTVLEKVLLLPSLVTVPVLQDDYMQVIHSQLSALKCHAEHKFVFDIDGEPGLSLVSSLNIDVRTMGRKMDEDREFFLSASAGGIVAGELMRE